MGQLVPGPVRGFGIITLVVAAIYLLMLTFIYRAPNSSQRKKLIIAGIGPDTLRFCRRTHFPFFDLLRELHRFPHRLTPCIDSTAI